MGTAERREASKGGGARVRGRRETGAAGHEEAAGATARVREAAAPPQRGSSRMCQEGARTSGPGREVREQRYCRPLWVEEPARRRRLPDPVRTAAVRAVLIIAVTLMQAMVAFLCTMTGSWLAFPMVISSVVSTIVATWGVLDVWVTRQVWNQRNGVVSTPSSTARALRRERRRARRRTRAAERAQGRIRERRGAGQLSHS
ncbi:hypothetical protein ACFW7K_29110 [Streptomyces sp. NPDC058735]|uniref:hypothetical protein n=1 Tax=Streptomyces sp. NPDC058735 TaxID=3346616 RepID=UPI0036902815